jgi:hypothetical protein
MMKLAIIADLHLGSKEVQDGRWKERALREVIVPELRRREITHIIFAGDTLDFQPDASRFSPERPELLQSAAAQLTGVPSFLLMGNHDDVESCNFFQVLGGPRLVQDDWIALDGNVGAYLMRPRQDTGRACSALKNLDVSRFQSRILVLHEDLTVFQDQEFLDLVHARFHLAVNGHNHVYRQVGASAYLLPACLPWKARLESRADITITSTADGQCQVEEPKPCPWGFLVVDPELRPEFVPISCGVALVICKIQAASSSLEGVIRETLERLLARPDPERLVVRAYVDPRVPADLESALKASYGARFLEMRFDPWRGPGTIARRARERLPTEDAALEHVRSEFGDWASAMVQQLATFFQLRIPRNRKEDILTIVKKSVPDAQDHA